MHLDKAVCGSGQTFGVPPYEFLNIYGIFDSLVFLEKQLDLKSFTVSTKAAQIGKLFPEFFSLRLLLKAL